MSEKLHCKWNQSGCGVWTTTIGEKPQDNLLSIAGIKPRIKEINKMVDTGFPFGIEVEVKKVRENMVIDFPLDSDEKIYGLGLQFQNINQRNKVYHLKVDHYGENDNGRTHAPCPFYVSSKGYGVFINTTKYVSVYVGSANRKDCSKLAKAKDRNTDQTWTASPSADHIEVALKSEGVEIIIFGGPSILEVVRRYNLFCGGGCLPPKWGLGIWKRVPTLYTDKQVLDVVKEFESKDFPIDVIGLEPGWHSKSYPCTYEWDENRFPQPKVFCEKLKEKDVMINLWENPYVSPDASIYEKLYPLSGSHDVWCGIVPDYTLPEAIKILQNQHQQAHVNIGISGYKIDECDGYDDWLWPNHAEFPSGHTGEEMRQTYGLQLQKLTTEIFKEQDKRTYGLVRASNSGGVSFPYVIYNDCYNFSQYITALINSSFCGVLWVPEVRSAKTAAEWVRRCQLVCFSPMAMVNSWASEIELWTFKEVENIVRDVMKLRKRIIPYLYSAFSRYYFEGIPPFRALVMDSNLINMNSNQNISKLDDTENPYQIAASRDIKDQFIVGDCLMVAPMMPDQEEREVILPEGDWYDFYTGEVVGNGEVIKIKPGLECIPLYVKDGGIIPMVSEKSEKDSDFTLEVRCYGKAEGRYVLYDDDGKTFAYERGEYNHILLTTNKDKKGNIFGNVEIIRNKINSNFKEYEFRFMSL